jgi:hypothetical protein
MLTAAHACAVLAHQELSYAEQLLHTLRSHRTPPHLKEDPVERRKGAVAVDVADGWRKAHANYPAGSHVSFSFEGLNGCAAGKMGP